MPRALLTPQAALVALEFRGSLGSFARAATRVGAVTFMMAHKEGLSLKSQLWPLNVGVWNEGEMRKQVDLVLAALTRDVEG